MRNLGHTRSVFRKIMGVLLALMLIPTITFAASSVNVEGTDHTEAASGTGSGGGTWSWDGADDMQLTDFVGGEILARGDLNVTLAGNNEVFGIRTASERGVSEGDLTLTGEDGATLLVGDGENYDRSDGSTSIDMPASHGYINSAAGITIENLDVDLDMATIVADGQMTITDSEVDGTFEGPVIRVNYADKVEDSDYYLKVSNSHVHVVDIAEYIGSISFSFPGAIVIHRVTDGWDDLGQDYEDFINKYWIDEETFDYDAFEQDYPEIAAKYDLHDVIENPASADAQAFELEVFRSEPFASHIDPNGRIIFEGVEGDIRLALIEGKGSYYNVFLVGPDDNTRDILIDPIKEPEEEATEESTTVQAESAPVTATVLPQTADVTLVVPTLLSVVAAVALAGGACAYKKN